MLFEKIGRNGSYRNRFAKSADYACGDLDL